MTIQSNINRFSAKTVPLFNVLYLDWGIRSHVAVD